MGTPNIGISLMLCYRGVRSSRPTPPPGSETSTRFPIEQLHDIVITIMTEHIYQAENIEQFGVRLNYTAATRQQEQGHSKQVACPRAREPPPGRPPVPAHTHVVRKMLMLHQGRRRSCAAITRLPSCGCPYPSYRAAGRPSCLGAAGGKGVFM